MDSVFSVMYRAARVFVFRKEDAILVIAMVTEVRG